MIQEYKNYLKAYSIIVLLVFAIRMFFKADAKTATLIPIIIYLLNI